MTVGNEMESTGEEVTMMKVTAEYRLVVNGEDNAVVRDFG